MSTKQSMLFSESKALVETVEKTTNTDGFKRFTEFKLSTF